MGKTVGDPFLMESEALDDLIAWRLNDPRFRNVETKEARNMQCQWTIEARADCSEAEKEAIKQTVQSLARHLMAQLKLLPTQVKCEVVSFSDDFFAGHHEISLLDDTLGEAKVAAGPLEDTGLSDELLQAARDMQHDKNNKT